MSFLKKRNRTSANDTKTGCIFRNVIFPQIPWVSRGGKLFGGIDSSAMPPPAFGESSLPALSPCLPFRGCLG